MSIDRINDPQVGEYWRVARSSFTTSSAYVGHIGLVVQTERKKVLLRFPISCRQSKQRAMDVWVPKRLLSFTAASRPQIPLPREL